MMQLIVLALASWAAWGVLCRLWALDRRHHRPRVVLGYVLAAVVDVVAAMAAAQGEAGVAHLAVVVLIGTHLAASHHAWADGIPQAAKRGDQ